MSILINLICFFTGTVFGVVIVSLCVAAGRADEEAGIK